MAGIGYTEYERGYRKIQRAVYFEGSTAVKLGQGVCYNADYGTAADVDPRRDTHVELPAQANCLWFAGVSDGDYAAKSGGQWIVINLPGSICDVLLGGVDTTVDATTLGCSYGVADAGRFGLPGCAIGRGAARALQSVTDGVIGTANWAGSTAALDATGLIITDSGATFSTWAILAGYRVVIVAGENDATNVSYPGVYPVASITSETVLVISAGANAAGTARTVAADGGTMQISYYLIKNTEPTCLAYLYTGDDCGMQEFVSDHNNAAVTVGGAGMSYMGPTATNAAGDCTTTLSTTVPPGVHKGFKTYGALTTHGWKITMAGIKADGSTALAAYEAGAGANDEYVAKRGVNIWAAEYEYGSGTES